MGIGPMPTPRRIVKSCATCAIFGTPAQQAANCSTCLRSPYKSNWVPKDLTAVTSPLEQLRERLRKRREEADALLATAPSRCGSCLDVDDCNFHNTCLKENMTKTTPASGIDATLAERGTRYGEFKDQATIAEGLNAVAVAASGWQRLAPDQREALRIIFNKVGRILNGDPNYSDSWHDIIGYAKLVDDRLKAEGK